MIPESAADGPEVHPPSTRRGVPLPQTALHLLSASFVLLFIALGFNQMVFPCLYTTTLLSLALLARTWQRMGKPKLSIHPFLPIPVLLYTAITPGDFFKDLPLADTMTCAYVTGLGAAVFVPEYIRRFMVCLLLTLSACFLYYCVAGFPEAMTFSGKPRLFFPHPNLMDLMILWCILYLLLHLHTLSVPYRAAVCFASLPALTAAAMSGGRSAYVGFTLAILFLTFTLWRKRALTALTGLAVLAISTYAVLPLHEQARLLSIVENPFTDKTFVSRLPIWEATWAGIRNRPLSGNSFRGFRDHHERYVQNHKADLEKRYPCVETSMGNPHSMYLGLPYIYGTAGMLLLILAFAPAVRLSIREHDFFLPAVLIFFIGYGLTDFPHNKDGAMTLLFPLGLVYGRQLLNTFTPGEKTVPFSSARPE